MVQDRSTAYDIPVKPNTVYEQKWQGWGDWLGTGYIATQNRTFLPFEEARAYVRGLNLANTDAWKDWSNSADRPANIPSAPYTIYADEWQDMGDWLGTDRKRKGTFLPFEEARTYVRSLGLKDQREWNEWYKETKPKHIPSAPHVTYGDQWQGLGDWIGTGRGKGNFWAFDEARTYVHSLGLKTAREWQRWCASNDRPPTIPTAPEKVYRDKFQGFGDWLGTGTRQKKKGKFLPFEEARAYVRSLGLKTQAEWTQWCIDGKRPADIPRQPQQTYDQWQGMADWLGKQPKRKAPGAKPRKKAA
jgi:hypothetical protein